jgi:regulator of nonsense transcripts 2
MYGVLQRYGTTSHGVDLIQNNVVRQVISAFHRRFPTAFTTPLVNALAGLLAPTPKSQLATLTPELREKDDSARISRQRPVLRVCSELALVGVIRDGPNKSGGEWIMKAMKELVCYFHCRVSYLALMVSYLQLSNDPTLSSIPLLSTFLKSYSRSFLGITPPVSKQVSAEVEPGTLSADVAAADGVFPQLSNENEELVEKETRDRFKRMCEGYFDNVSKKLVIEHKVRRLMVQYVHI